MLQLLRKHQLQIVVCLCATAISLFVISTMKAQSHNKFQEAQRGNKLRDFTEGLQVVDFDEKLSIENTDQVTQLRREQKSARYGNRRGPSSVHESPLGIYNLPTNTHWTRGLKALPVEQSAIVATATVTQARALLSTDKTGVYSEFTLKVEGIFVTDRSSLKEGDMIVADREGGAVRFRSGKIDSFRIAGQNYPQIGIRYLFFLRRENEEDLSIITAYRLVDGYAYPLDDSDLFDLYRGAMEGELIERTRNAIKEQKGRSNQ